MSEPTAPPQVEDLKRGPVERDSEGRLTHKGMRQVLGRGGSVVYKGNHLTTIDQLPDQIRVEGNSIEALDAMEEDLDAQEAELAAKRKRIAKKKAKLEAEPEKKEREPADYESMSKKDLFRLAEKRNLEPAERASKETLIKLLSENEPEAAEEESCEEPGEGSDDDSSEETSEEG